MTTAETTRRRGRTLSPSPARCRPPRLATLCVLGLLVPALLGTGQPGSPETGETGETGEAGAAGAATAASAPPAWTRLVYRASRLGIAIEPVMRLETMPAEQAMAAWTSAPRVLEGEPLAPRGERVARMTLDSRFLGRASHLVLWFDPATGEAYRREQVETGGKVRRRVYRFARGGAGRVTWQSFDGDPADPASWHQRQDTWEGFAPQTAERPVSESSALLYLLSRAGLHQTGDRLVVLAFSKGGVMEVTVRVEGWVQESVDYRLEIDGGDPTRVGGARILLRTSLTARPVEAPEGATGETTMELLGLRGQIEVLLDPEYRLPVELLGRIPVFGKVRVRLREAAVGSPSEA